MIAGIYNEAIDERTATFETERRTPERMAAEVLGEARLALVAEVDGAVIGWAKVDAESPRQIRRGIGEYGVYVSAIARRHGIGRLLLDAVCDAAAEGGHFKLIGRIFVSNEPSLALARECGFREVGVHRRHGQLDGGWRDVVVVERLLGVAAGDG